MSNMQQRIQKTGSPVSSLVSYSKDSSNCYVSVCPTSIKPRQNPATNFLEANCKYSYGK